MALRDYRHALQDMLSAIDGIQKSTFEKSFADYREDWLLKRGVERGIEIISEASRTIPISVQALRPEIPWPRVRAIGNVLRHEYHSLVDEVIWNVVVDELPRLKTALLAIRAAAEDT